MKLLSAWAAILLIVTASATAVADPPGSIHVEGAWIRWLPASLPAAGYVTIVNGGEAAVSLTSASSPDYGSVKLMQSRLAHGDSSMVNVARIEVPAHGRASLAPGGYHLMLMHAARSIHPGGKVTVKLRFANGTALQVIFPCVIRQRRRSHGFALRDNQRAFPCACSGRDTPSVAVVAI